MKCKNCGAEINPGEKFCTECGAKVEIERTCPKCGAVCTSRFCPECGYDTETPEVNTIPVPPVSPAPAPKPEPTPAPQQNYSGVYQDPTPQKKPKTGLIVGILAVVVILCVGVGALFMGGSDDSNKPTETIVNEKKSEKKKDIKVEPTPKVSSKEDLLLLDLIPSNSDNATVKSICEKNNFEYEKYEGTDCWYTSNSINGYDVEYMIVLNKDDDEEYFEVLTDLVFDTDEEYEETLDLLIHYLDANFEEDPYDINDESDEYVYGNDRDFIMLIVDKDERDIYVYRSVI